MKTENFDLLNKTYQKLNKRRDDLLNLLKEGDGYNLNVAYYSHHYFKENEEFYLEEFPIPVITINDFIDIGVDIDEYFLEARIAKEYALIIDYDFFEMPFELYGLESFLDDIHNANLDIRTIKDRIEESKEEEFGLSFGFAADCDLEKILDLISILMHF